MVLYKLIYTMDFYTIAWLMLLRPDERLHGCPSLQFYEAPHTMREDVRTELQIV